jgi:hypothetical protein
MADPDWWHRAVLYQIYPRSFQDGDGDGVGDIAGICQRLDHLVELGVDALWLSPVFPSPMADFGYDVSDYCDIDPLFGSLADFDAVLADAHARLVHLARPGARRRPAQQLAVGVRRRGVGIRRRERPILPSHLSHLAA